MGNYQTFQHLHFDCFSGVSGNMVLGALFDAGLPEEPLVGALRTIAVEKWELRLSQVMRGPIRCTHCQVVLREKSHRHRHLEDISALIERARLPEEVKLRSKEAFTLLARCEGAVHGIPPQEVTFHEIGAVDSIVDIVGSCLGIYLLGAPGVTCSPLAVGRGTAHTAHGTIPVPSPATCEVLKGVPIRQHDIPHELTTPTGAALMVVHAERFGPAPSMVLECVGYGAGSDRPQEVPNVLRVLAGAPQHDPEAQLCVLETNLDNVSAELTGYLFEKLLAEGALDVFFTPVVMKKSRAAHVVSVVCKREDLERLSDCIFKNVPTLGIRYYPVSRLALARRHVEIQTPWGAVRVKEALRSGKVLSAYPEYEDLKEKAQAAGWGMYRFRQYVMRRWWEERGNLLSEPPEPEP